MTEPSKGDARRASLIQAAFTLIATGGLEGLRTRDVAAAVGVNIATLHYYFPTKEDLVAAVAQSLAIQFAGAQTPRGSAPQTKPLDRLAREFANARLYLGERSDLVVVMQELLLRGRRDPAIERLVAPILHWWRVGLEKLIAASVADGTFHRTIDPAAAASVMCSAITGALFSPVDPEQLDKICATLEAWLKTGHAKA